MEDAAHGSTPERFYNMKAMPTERSSALKPVVDDLRQTFGDRLLAVVSYGWRHQGPIPSLALVSTLTLDDLNACAGHARAWRRAGAAIPLLLTRQDFVRSLDAFPVEYGEILAHHEVIVCDDPFHGLSIRLEDLRRACEVQVKSHVIHLREDYLESGGRPSEIDALVRESAPGVVAILRQLARLDGGTAHTTSDLARYATHRIGLDPHVIGDLLSLGDRDGLPTVDTVKLFGPYLSAMERLTDFVDRWREA
jgi:hypothetical protein